MWRLYIETVTCVLIPSRYNNKTAILLLLLLFLTNMYMF